MIRVYCDGCWPRMNDLTSRNDYARVPEIGTSRILHLCPENCMPVYDKYLARRDELEQQTAASKQRAMKELRKAFREELERGSQKTAEEEATATTR